MAEDLLRKKKKKEVNGLKKQMKMSKEVLESTIKKKKECNDRAMNIVERLIEPNVDANWMLDNLKYLNQCHFDDIVEERSITRSCGYPLCDNTLSDIPTKTYHISTKQNRVFDITDRKKYCSNLCYKAGTYLKDQMYTSPLWLHDTEEPVKYRLYSIDSRSCGSGVEVNIGLAGALNIDSDVNFSATVDEDKDRDEAASGCTIEEKIDFEITESIKLDIKFSPDSSKITIREKESTKDVKVIEKKLKEMKVSDGKSPTCSSSSSSSSSSSGNSQKKNSDVVAKIEEKIRSWMTFETLAFLLGDNRMEELLAENRELLKNYEQSKLVSRPDPFVYERYEDICRKLNARELREAAGESSSGVKRPLPDYKQLQEEAKEMDIKVKSFYKGDTVVRFEEQEPKLDDDDSLPVLPPVDQFAMKATRRKIVLDRLNKTLPDIQNALGLSHYNIKKDVIDFVGLLNLTATNISFRPSEWTFIAIVILKLLTLKDNHLQSAFETEGVCKYLQLILMSYNLDLQYLNRLMVWLTDIGYLLDKRLE